MTSPLSYQSLFESSPSRQLVMGSDRARTIEAVSDAYLEATLTRREHLLGRPMFEAFPDNPTDPAATGVRNLGASVDRALRSRRKDTMAFQRYDIRAPGGQFVERWWTPINVPVEQQAGRLVILHRVEDVTDYVHLQRRALEEHRIAVELRRRSDRHESEIFARAREIGEINRALRENLEVQDCVLGVVAHDLRTPLGTVGLLASMIARQTALPAAALNAASRIAANVGRMQRLIAELLDYVPYSSTAGPLAVVTVDMAELCRQALQEEALLHPDRTIRCVTEGDTSLDGDPDRLIRVVINLVENAIKHGVDPVEIAIGGDANGLTLSVWNAGAPIPADLLPDRIFEPFRRAHRASTGVGLGLHIVRAIVQAHGGTVTARSSARDGTRFVVRLPRVPPASHRK